MRLKSVAPSQGKLTSFVGESGVKVKDATSLNICAAMVGNAVVVDVVVIAVVVVVVVVVVLFFLVIPLNST